MALSKRALGQPFLSATGSFPLFGLTPHAWFFVKPTTFQLTEQSISRELFLGNTKCFLHIVINDPDFHCFSAVVDMFLLPQE